MSTLNVRLPEDLENLLAREAELAHKPRSELAREAIRTYLEQLERERYMGELERAARTIAEDRDLRQEAEATAEAFQPLEEEAAEADRPPEEDDAKPWWK